MRKYLAGAVLLIAMAGCTRTVAGPVAAPAWTADQVAGLPITTGTSGPRPGVADARLAVAGTDGGVSDRLSADAVDDVQTYWAQVFPAVFGRTYRPVAGLASYDSAGPGRRLCGNSTAGLTNAFYCGTDDTVSWDRGELLPSLAGSFGAMAVVTVFAHELGHAVQSRLGAGGSPSIVREQQADCFAGSYFRWVAQGQSPRFQLSTGPGLNQILATLFFIRDPAGGSVNSPSAHGDAFDRISAFQLGFGDGPARCARIDESEVRGRVTQPATTSAPDADSNVDIADPQALSLLEDTLAAVFGPARPSLIRGAGCGPGAAAYCTRDDSIRLDLAALSAIGAPPGPGSRGIGDFAAFAEVASRYALAYERAQGLPLTGIEAAQRTACLTGVWAASITAGRGQRLQLSPGDLDEAVAEMLAGNSLIAADAQGASVPSGFARSDSFRRGFTAGTPARCLDR